MDKCTDCTKSFIDEGVERKRLYVLERECIECLKRENDDLNLTVENLTNNYKQQSEANSRFIKWLKQKDEVIKERTQYIIKTTAESEKEIKDTDSVAAERLKTIDNLKDQTEEIDDALQLERHHNQELRDKVETLQNAVENKADRINGE